jgi:hypothetical protein
LATNTRYTREAEAAAAAEDEHRKAAVKASRVELAASLEQQVREHKALQHCHDDEEEVCAGWRSRRGHAVRSCC